MATATKYQIARENERTRGGLNLDLVIHAHLGHVDKIGVQCLARHRRDVGLDDLDLLIGIRKGRTHMTLALEANGVQPKRLTCMCTQTIYLPKERCMTGQSTRPATAWPSTVSKCEYAMGHRSERMDNGTWQVYRKVCCQRQTRKI